MKIALLGHGNVGSGVSAIIDKVIQVLQNN